MAKNLEVATLLDIYAAVLTDKQREVIELYYLEDLSLGEIAENCGITRQGVRDSIKRGEAVMFDLESKLGFSRIAKENADRIRVIRDSARDILLFNNKYLYSAPVKKMAETIIAQTEQDETEQDFYGI